MSEIKPYIKQSIVFLVEVSLIVGIFTYLSLIVFPISEFSWSIFERCLTIFTFYEFLIYATLKLMNDAHKDAYNTLKVNYENALIYFDLLNYNKDLANEYKKRMLAQIKIQYREDLLNPKEVNELYEKLEIYLENNDLIDIKFELNNINHWLYHLDLEFMHSFLLRIFKKPTLTEKEKKSLHNKLHILFNILNKLY